MIVKQGVRLLNRITSLNNVFYRFEQDIYISKAIIKPKQSEDKDSPDIINHSPVTANPLGQSQSQRLKEVISIDNTWQSCASESEESEEIQLIITK